MYLGFGKELQGRFLNWAAEYSNMSDAKERWSQKPWIGLAVLACVIDVSMFFLAALSFTLDPDPPTLNLKPWTSPHLFKRIPQATWQGRPKYKRSGVAGQPYVRLRI